jgi:spoIIIJ-associated protein
MNEQTGSPERKKIAESALQEILRLMGFEGRIETFDQEDDAVLLHIETPDAARLIGRNAQVLDALQIVVSRILTRQTGLPARCTVDVERYRERQKDRLLQLALETAEQVEQTGEPVKLAPMGSADRRIVHQALKDRVKVRTFSEEIGEEGLKRVVIAPGAADSAAALPAEPA